MPLSLKAHAPAPLALALLAGTALFAQPAHAQFSITANITDPQNAPSATADADIQNALNFFSSDFATNGTPAFAMTENITWADLGANGLGGSVNGNSSFQNENGTLYINPLDRYLYGDKAATSGPGYTDINLVFNNNPLVPLDYTLGTPSDFNTYSLATSVYHETLHSMGFGAAINGPPTKPGDPINGSYTFGAPTVWDNELFDATTGLMFTDPNETDAERAACIVSGDANGDGGSLLFVGKNAEAANGGKPVVMYAPSTFEPGSSDGSHIAYGQDNGGPLYPGLFNGSYLPPTAVDLGMMEDIGWKLATPAAAPAVPEAPYGALFALGLLPLGLAARKRLSRRA